MSHYNLDKSLQQLDGMYQQHATETKISEKARGENFEKLVKYYFENDPVYRGKFNQVYDKDNIPEVIKQSIGQTHDNDLGIDLLAIDTFGKVSAIQIKRYEKAVDYKDVVTFLDQYHKNANIDYGIIVSNSIKGPSKNLLTQLQEDDNLTYVGLNELAEFDFEGFFTKSKPQDQMKLRGYQTEAIETVVNGFKKADRGQLIMATGTGKTFTSIKIVEQLAKKHDGEYRVLYVMPTLQLLKQTLENYWKNAPTGQENFYSLAINSDSKTTKNTQDQLLGFPATTNSEGLLKQYQAIANKKKVLVFFSTYQSVQTIHDAQTLGLPDFDLIIADEAHKTVGTSDKDKELKVFQQVLPDDFILAKKRLFQTATPKVFRESVTAKAEARNLDVFVMSNKEIYGKEFYNYSLGQAIKDGYLTDYQIIVSAIWDDDERVINLLRQMSDPKNEKDMKKYNEALDRLNNKKQSANTVKQANEFDKAIKETEKERRSLELQINRLEADIGKFINLSKSVDSKGQKIISSKRGEINDENLRVNRLLGFSDTNTHAKQQVEIFKNIQTAYTEQVHLDGTLPTMLNAEVANGTMNVREKTKKITDFAKDYGENHVNFLNNVRFLTEGIDVPNLDAVVFLQPKKSEVDIVQAVGRSLRLDQNNPNKVAKIIIPALLRRNAQQKLDLGNTETNALDDAGFKTLREVIYNLRANDSRLEDEVDLAISVPSTNSLGEPIDVSLDIDTQFLQNVANSLQTTVVEEAQLADIYQFRRDIASYAKNTRALLSQHLKELTDNQKNIYHKFYDEMNQIIDIADTKIDFVDTLTQHISLDPLLMAYFAPGTVNEYEHNPVRLSFEKFLYDIDFKRPESYQITQLVQFISRMVDGVRNPRKLQDILNSIYEVYFNADKDNNVDSSLKATVKPTPSPVVDYMVDAVDELLQTEFHTNLNSQNVGILEPFVGTGTVLVHIMMYLREKLHATDDEILFKFKNQLFGQELLLIAYYIASANLQVELKALTKHEVPYDNLVMGNTFMSLDPEKYTTMNFGYLDTNVKKLAEQYEAPIKVIMGNPPYLSQAMAPYQDIQTKSLEWYKDTEVSALVNLTNAPTLSNTYVGALTYAIERLNDTDQSIIAYVFPHDWLIAPTTIGIRKYLLQHFKAVYILDLKGSYRLDFGGKQGGNVFDIMQGVAIVVLVKDSTYKGDASIHYKELADMSKQDKFDWLNQHTLKNTDFTILEPDEKYNYFPSHNQYEKLYDSKYQELLSIPYQRGLGLKSNRDSWVINSSKKVLVDSIRKQITYFNNNVVDGHFADGKKESRNFKYTRSNKPVKIDDMALNSHLKQINYRPFVKKWIYAPSPEYVESSQFIERYRELFKNYVDGELLFVNSIKQIDLVATKGLTDLNYLKQDKIVNVSSSEGSETGVSDLNLFNEELSAHCSDSELENNGALMYAVAHTPQYRASFSNLVQDYYRYPVITDESVKNELITIGQKLIALHLNYDKPEAPRYGEEHISYFNINQKDNLHYYDVNKIKFDKGDNRKLIFNDNIIICDLPDEVFEYELNGKPAIQHIMQHYQFDANASTANKKSSEVPDDPNLIDISDYWQGGRYVFEILLRVIQLSIETESTIKQLGKIESKTNFLGLTENNNPIKLA